MTNREIAEIFLEIADLLDLDGERFKPEAYRRAARAVEGLADDAGKLAKAGRIREVRGIGDALAKKIEEYADTGKIEYLDRLRSSHPPGLLAMMKLPGVGPKTTGRFYGEFGIKSIEGLRRAIDAGRLNGVRGFGDRKIALLRAAIETGGSAARTPLPVAQREADLLIEALMKSGAPIEKLHFAGSLRRRRETVGDLDLLATSSEPTKVMAAFTHLPGVREVRLSGDTKTTVVRDSGMQVDLRVVKPDAFGAAMQYLTGSKEHNVRVRTLALQKGLSINEYGVTSEGERVSTPTEEEVYSAAGLQYIPPEIRENNGEIELALQHELPPLIQMSDVKGELHIHVPPEVREDALEPWLKETKALGLLYAGFVVDAVDMDVGKVLELRERLPKESSGVRIFVGLEGSWPDPEQPGAIPKGVDFMVLRPPFSPGGGTSPVPKHGWHRAFGGHLDQIPGEGLNHLMAQLSGSKAYPLEVGISERGISLESSQIRRFVETGGSVAVSSNPTHPRDLRRLGLAAGLAARGWAKPGDVLNARKDPFSE